MLIDRRRSPTRWLELGLAGALLAELPAAAFATPPPVRLETSARVGLPPEELPTFESAFIDATRRGVEEAGSVDQANAPTRLVVEVAWEDERRITYVGRIEVHESDDANAKPLAIRSFACKMCGAGDLFVRVQSEVALALGTVTWPLAEPVATLPTAAGPASPVDDGHSPRARVGLRPLGWSGVGVASVGVVAITVGAVLWSRDDRLVLRPEDPDGPVWKRSFRPPGIGLVASGVGAMLVGGVLVVVDVVRERRRAVAVQPAVGLGFAGVRVEGRF